MEQVYSAVLAAQKAAIAALVPDTPLSAVYEAAVAVLHEKAPEDVVSKLGKNIGFAMGLELREAKLQIAAGNHVKVQAGQVFNVSVGLSGLENPGSESARDQCVALPISLVFGWLWVLLCGTEGRVPPEMWTRDDVLCVIARRCHPLPAVWQQCS